MANVTSSADNSTRNTLVAVSLIVVFCLAVVLNSLVIFTFARLKRARKAQNYFLISLAITDLVAAIFWLAPSIYTALKWNWLLGNGFCQVHGFVWTLCYATNLHTCVYIAIEKCLKIWRPSKHIDLFYHTIVIIAIVSLLPLDVVIASFSLLGWGEFRYIPAQYACANDYVKSRSHLSFKFVVVFAIPFVACAVLYEMTFIRIHRLRRDVSPSDGAVVLEEDKTIPETSYADQLSKQQRKLEYSQRRNKTNATSYYDSDESDPTFDIDNEDRLVQSYHEWRRMKQDKRVQKKRMYELKKHDLSSALTGCINWLLFSALWFPFIVTSYIGAYNSGTVSVNAVIAVTWFTYLSTACKPLVYATNAQFRKMFLSAVRRQPK